MTESETKQTRNRTVLMGLDAHCPSAGGNIDDTSTEELADLLGAAGDAYVGTVLRNKDAPNPRTFIGEGKAVEVKELVRAMGADTVVVDNPLSLFQQWVLSGELGVQVLDRVALTLNIFVQRIRIREGRLRAGPAQYQHLLSRLLGMQAHLERQEGAIGTRGPGEARLEADRWHICRKIQKLREGPEQVWRVRATQCIRREKNEMPVVAIVGYTNVGEFTLLNRLTGAGIPVNNWLFDTLGTTTRTLEVSGTCTMPLSDTVDFIRRLPYRLVEAFKATLGELNYADLLLHAIDTSNLLWRKQTAVMEQLIVEPGAERTPRVDVFGKCDEFTSDILPREADVVPISAKTDQGLDELLEKIGGRLDAGAYRAVLRLPYDRDGVVDMLHRQVKVERVDYGEATGVETVCTPVQLDHLKDYIVSGWMPPEEPWEGWGTP